MTGTGAVQYHCVFAVVLISSFDHLTVIVNRQSYIVTISVVGDYCGEEGRGQRAEGRTSDSARARCSMDNWVKRR